MPSNDASRPGPFTRGVLVLMIAAIGVCLVDALQDSSRGKTLTLSAAEYEETGFARPGTDRSPPP